MGVPQNGGFIRENPAKIDEQGYSQLWKAPTPSHTLRPRPNPERSTGSFSESVDSSKFMFGSADTPVGPITCKRFY